MIGQTRALLGCDWWRQNEAGRARWQPGIGRLAELPRGDWLGLGPCEGRCTELCPASAPALATPETPEHRRGHGVAGAARATGTKQ